MELEPLETFTLGLQPDGAVLRTDLGPSIGNTADSQFSTDFQLIREVHGGFDPGDTDNASLLVIRVVPFSKSGKQFKKFTVDLSVHALPGNTDGSVYIVAFEPASEGMKFYDTHTRNEQRQRMGQINASVPVAQAASFGGQLSNTHTSSFTTTKRLTVRGSKSRNELSLPPDKDNCASWVISAASEDQGVGDWLTVALLVQRPTGVSFRLDVEVKAEFEGLAAAARRMMPHKRKKTLFTFPRDHSNKRVPPGISVDNLHAASTTNVMRSLEEVGLHLPEEAQPVIVDKGTVSASSSLEPHAAHQENATAAQEIPVDPVRKNTVPTIPTSAEPSAAASLAVIMQQLQGPYSASARRARRHREMATLYEQLAQLHRDEANELQANEDALYLDEKDDQQ